MHIQGEHIGIIADAGGKMITRDYARASKCKGLFRVIWVNVLPAPISIKFSYKSRATFKQGVKTWLISGS
jgi:hypothetical protein